MILDKLTGLNTSIGIAGDSWSMGEWFPFNPGGNYIDTIPALSHRSPEIYLHEYYNNIKVYHLGRQGDCNTYQSDISYKIKDHLDFAIVYWTCPSRDMLNQWEHKLGIEKLKNLTSESYENICYENSRDRLEELNSCGFPILLIGGQVSLPDVSEYSNIIAVVERMTNLIDYPFWDEKTNQPMSGKLNNKLDYDGMIRLTRINESYEVPAGIIDYLEDKIKEFGIRQRYNPKYFPDQGHGNRLVHKLTMEKIKEVIDNNNLINTIVN